MKRTNVQILSLVKELVQRLFLFICEWVGPFIADSFPEFLSADSSLSISWISFLPLVSTVSVCAGCHRTVCKERWAFFLSLHKISESDILMCLFCKEKIMFFCSAHKWGVLRRTIYQLEYAIPPLLICHKNRRLLIGRELSNLLLPHSQPSSTPDTSGWVQANINFQRSFGIRILPACQLTTSLEAGPTLKKHLISCHCNIFACFESILLTHTRTLNIKVREGRSQETYSEKLGRGGPHTSSFL